MTTQRINIVDDPNTTTATLVDISTNSKTGNSLASNSEIFNFKIAVIVIGFVGTVTNALTKHLLLPPSSIIWY